MRWRFPDPANDLETRARRTQLERIDHFWQAFSQLAPRLKLVADGQPTDAPERVAEAIAGLGGGLGWEVGPLVRGGEADGLRLVITGQVQEWPFVEAVVARAPVLQGWRVLAGRPAEELETALFLTRGRTGLELGPDMTFKLVPGVHGLLDVVLHAPAFDQLEPADASGASLVLLQLVLGEQTVERWVGVVAGVPFRRRTWARRVLGHQRSEGLPSIRLLPGAVAGAIEQRSQALPERPRFVAPAVPASTDGTEQKIGSVFKLEPAAAEDFGGHADLLVASSWDTDVWMATHSGVPFFSGRFSRCGETFCYLKLDGRAPGLEGSQFADRGSLSDAIDEALLAAGLGCSIGGGTGLIYSYIDLALTDVGAAAEVIRRVLRGGRVQNRTWLLFFDTELAGEWIGLSEAAPPPPALHR